MLRTPHCARCPRPWRRHHSPAPGLARVSWFQPLSICGGVTFSQSKSHRCGRRFRSLHETHGLRTMSGFRLLHAAPPPFSLWSPASPSSLPPGPPESPDPWACLPATAHCSLCLDLPPLCAPSSSSFTRQPRCNFFREAFPDHQNPQPCPPALCCYKSPHQCVSLLVMG